MQDANRQNEAVGGASDTVDGLTRGIKAACLIEFCFIQCSRPLWSFTGEVKRRPLIWCMIHDIN